MSRSLKFALFTLGFLIASGFEAARADEAFLCPGGKIVYVPFGKLDEMKRTNACVAGHFGLKVPDAGPAAAAHRQPAAAENKAEPASRAVKLRPLEDPELAARRTERPQRLAGPAPLPRAAEGTDYRNITILNAPSGDGQIYRHVD